MLRTSVLLLIGAAAAEAFTGAPALSGLRTGVTSLNMAQAAPPATGKELPKAKIQALEINAEQWGIKAGGAQSSSGTQGPPPATGKPLPKAKTEALAVNQKQWGIGGSAAAASAPAEEMDPVVIAPGVDYIAKLEALSSKYIKKLESV